jgi:hypothetical chaperone protein
VTVIGVDFGTTNTVVSLLLPDGTAQTVRHRFGTAELDVVRTLLCFWNEGSGKHLALRNGVGPAAIEAYLDDPLESRLMMSLKSYLAQRSFTETRVFGRSFTLEDLIALFLRPVVPQITEGAVLVAGRPVRFAGDAADDALGERRLRRAYADIGWGQVQTALEPEAAGYRFARSLTAPATVLIGDFGGGTSDFSVLRFEPGSNRPVQPLGHSGVGLAGLATAGQGQHLSRVRQGSAGAGRVLFQLCPLAPAVADAGAADDAGYRNGRPHGGASGAAAGVAAAGAGRDGV